MLGVDPVVHAPLYLNPAFPAYLAAGAALVATLIGRINARQGREDTQRQETAATVIAEKELIAERDKDLVEQWRAMNEFTVKELGEARLEAERLRSRAQLSEQGRDADREKFDLALSRAHADLLALRSVVVDEIAREAADVAVTMTAAVADIDTKLGLPNPPPARVRPRPPRKDHP